MNAALLGKSAKGLVLASGLALVTSVPGFAQDAPVSLGALASTPLAALYLNPPAGAVTLGGKPFQVSGFDWLATGQSGTFAASFAGPTGVYLLLNSSYTSPAYAGVTVGSVRLAFTDGTSQVVNLVVGGNVREWQVGNPSTVNTVSDPSNTNVWLGTCCGGGTAAAIDMLSVPVTATTKTLASVSVSNTDATGGGLQLQVYGIAVSYTPPAPAPAPTPTPTPSVSADPHGNPDNHGKHLGELKHPNDGDTKAKDYAYGIAKHESD